MKISETKCDAPTCDHKRNDFDPGPGFDEHISEGNDDIFLSKFDSAGNFIWARTCGGIGDDNGWGIAIDGSGNANITGSFEGSVNFAPGLGFEEHNSNGFEDIFLCNFTPEGDW